MTANKNTQLTWEVLASNDICVAGFLCLADARIFIKATKGFGYQLAHNGTRINATDFEGQLAEWEACYAY